MSTKAFKSTVRQYRFSNTIIAVAWDSPDGTWRAVIDVVSGKDHYCEWRAVQRTGTPLDASIARTAFPHFNRLDSEYKTCLTPGVSMELHEPEDD